SFRHVTLPVWFPFLRVPAAKGAHVVRTTARFSSSASRPPCLRLRPRGAGSRGPAGRLSGANSILRHRPVEQRGPFGNGFRRPVGMKDGLGGLHGDHTEVAPVFSAAPLLTPPPPGQRQAPWSGSPAK